MLRERIKQFEINFQRAKELVGLGESVERLTSGALDATDIYRAALVQAVAALDTYMHGVLLDYSVEMLCGSRVGGPTTKIGLPIGVVAELVGARDSTELQLAAVAHVSQRLAKETFQRADSIAQGLSSVGVEKVWSKAFGAGSAKVTEALGLVVYRRNQIVHACDIDPADSALLLTLSPSDALAAIETIGVVVRGIHKIL